ncbi:MAG: hypothetical protein DMG65_10975 [Candidatus Angelobacter sp. Gp1-AA117]|nr:MAG: hypothetical protein DMG65_10975 [Candidatus Angelobacter sp. Gp1-AA117]
MNARAAVVPILPAIQLKRILYATDFSEASRKALPMVAAVARKYHARVFLAHIWQPIPYPMATPEALTALEQLQEREVRKDAEELSPLPQLSGLEVEIVTASGDPREELQHIVHDRNIDLAILSTHGRTGFRHLMMGSVAEELFRNLPCPVLTIGPHIADRFTENTPIREILFATDLSPESRAVFPFLAALADEYDARITVLHVLPEETGTNPDVRRLSAPLRDHMEQMFRDEVAPMCKVDFVIDSGDAAEKILAYARYLNAELIGFGVRHTSDIVTHLQKTIAYCVVMQAECPVLTSRGQV